MKKFSINIFKAKSESGFTIVELMIATAVFTVVLLICTFAMLRIGQTYYKGITSSTAQSTARAILDDISQSIQFSNADVTPPDYSSGVTAGNVYFFCAGNKRYTFKLNVQATATNGVLGKDDVGDLCPPLLPTSPIPPAGAVNYKELIGQRMRLAKLTVTQPDSTKQFYTITVRIVYGDSDLLSDKLNYDGTPVPPGDGILDSCKTGAGAQFCSVSELTTSVNRRKSNAL